MRFLISIILFFWTAYGFSQFGFPIELERGVQQDTFQERPEFYVLDWKNGTMLTRTETGISIEIDSMGLQNVDLLKDKNGKPILYVSEISTPVCADGNCRLMDIRLYWTLLGDYAGFDRYPMLPLTKHDHDEFLIEDYIRLHHLLIDNNSILKKRTIDELVEKPKKTIENEVDALSGATVAEIKEAVVSGALYSCYTAWHIVHGRIKGELKNYTLSILKDDMIIDMLTSNNTNYQIFAIDKLDIDGYRKHFNDLITIYETGIPLVRAFVLKKMPNDFWIDEELQSPFWKLFGNIDTNSRSLLLDRIDSASNTTLELISSQLGVMTKNQLKIYLAHLRDISDFSPKINNNFVAFVNSENEVYSYLVEDFLKEYQD